MTKVDVLSNINKPKQRYKITNWSAYNSGLKQRGSLTLWGEEKVSKTDTIPENLSGYIGGSRDRTDHTTNRECHVSVG